MSQEEEKVPLAMEENKAPLPKEVDVNSELLSGPSVILPPIQVKVPKSASVLYNEEVADRITDLYMQGKTLHFISKQAEMPAYATIMRWAKDQSLFRSKLQAAREVRALAMEDQALARATDESLGKDDIAGARLAYDAFRWAAEVSDPKVYGKKTTIQGDNSAPIQFLISTGFPPLTEEQRQPKLGPDGLVVRHKEHKDNKEQANTKRDVETASRVISDVVIGEESGDNTIDGEQEDAE